MAKLLVLAADMVKSLAVAKKGKPRSIQKRPTSNKTQLWKKAACVREGAAVGSRGLKERVLYNRTLPELRKASDANIVKMLRQDKLPIGRGSYVLDALVTACRL